MSARDSRHCWLRMAFSPCFLHWALFRRTRTHYYCTTQSPTGQTFDATHEERVCDSQGEGCVVGSRRVMRMAAPIAGALVSTVSMFVKRDNPSS